MSDSGEGKDIVSVRASPQRASRSNWNSRRRARTVRSAAAPSGSQTVGNRMQGLRSQRAGQGKVTRYCYQRVPASKKSLIFFSFAIYNNLPLFRKREVRLSTHVTKPVYALSDISRALPEHPRRPPRCRPQGFHPPVPCGRGEAVLFLALSRNHLEASGASGATQPFARKCFECSVHAAPQKVNSPGREEKREGGGPTSRRDSPVLAAATPLRPTAPVPLPAGAATPLSGAACAPPLRRSAPAAQRRRVGRAHGSGAGKGLVRLWLPDPPPRPSDPWPAPGPSQSQPPPAGAVVDRLRILRQGSVAASVPRLV